MKKKIILLILMLLAYFPMVHGQTLIHNDSILALVHNTPSEKIFVHYNTSLLFAGEYLYYKIYNINAETNKLSEISKIAYIELVDEDGERLFRQKISLENGLGQGDFFIPTSAESGNYKLLTYTQWMLNGGIKNIFKGELVVINPYRGNQDRVRQQLKNDSSMGTINFERTRSIGTTSGEKPILKLFIDNHTFGKRQRVELRISMEGQEVVGNFSISVRKIDDFQSPLRYTAEDYSSFYPKNRYEFKNNKIFLPELRGDLILGKIIPEQNQEDLSVADLDLAFSIPEDKILRIVKTDEKGHFKFSIDKNYFGSNAFAQILNETASNYDILLDENPVLDYTLLEFDNFVISSEMEEAILQRSVYNQIQNSYFSVKSDTIKLPSAPEPFYGDLAITYQLEDYDRFHSVRETFVEIIKSAWIKRNEAGDYVFEVKDYQTNPAFDAKTMLLVDGLLVQDHGDLVEYNALGIEHIGLVRNIYYLGPKIFQGIVILQTGKGDFYETYSSDIVKHKTLNPPQPIKYYYRQSYETNEAFKEHIPDFRTQLLWEPAIPLEEKNTTIVFYTSDIPGDYEIVLEGFTKDGKPVSIRKMIRVE